MLPPVGHQAIHHSAESIVVVAFDHVDDFVHEGALRKGR